MTEWFTEILFPLYLSGLSLQGRSQASSAQDLGRGQSVPWEVKGSPRPLQRPKASEGICILLVGRWEEGGDPPEDKEGRSSEPKGTREHQVLSPPAN